MLLPRTDVHQSMKGPLLNQNTCTIFRLHIRAGTQCLNPVDQGITLPYDVCHLTCGPPKRDGKIYGFNEYKLQSRVNQGMQSASLLALRIFLRRKTTEKPETSSLIHLCKQNKNKAAWLNMISLMCSLLPINSAATRCKSIYVLLFSE